jgi:hypothetical protein
MLKYRLTIPRNSDMEKFMDTLINSPYILNVGRMVKLDNPQQNRVIGMYMSSLKDKGVMGFFHEPDLNETVGILNVKNIEKINGRGKTLWYDFELPSI